MQLPSSASRHNGQLLIINSRSRGRRSCRHISGRHIRGPTQRPAYVWAHLAGELARRVRAGQVPPLSRDVPPQIRPVQPTRPNKKSPSHHNAGRTGYECSIIKIGLLGCWMLPAPTYAGTAPNRDSVSCPLPGWAAADDLRSGLATLPSLSHINWKCNDGIAGTGGSNSLTGGWHNPPILGRLVLGTSPRPVRKMNRTRTNR